MLITVMAKSLNLKYLINHLIHDESDKPNSFNDDDSAPPLTYVHARSLFQQLRDLYESKLVVEFCTDEPPDIDDVGLHYLEASVEELIDQISSFLDMHEIIVAQPICSKGTLLLVMTTRR